MTASVSYDGYDNTFVIDGDFRSKIPATQLKPLLKYLIAIGDDATLETPPDKHSMPEKFRGVTKSGASVWIYKRGNSTSGGPNIIWRGSAYHRLNTFSCGSVNVLLKLWEQHYGKKHRRN